MANQELFPKRDTAIFICSRGRRASPQCRYCNRPSTKYCDYAIDKSVDSYKACDAPMCERCAFHLPGGVDYCRLHKPDGAKATTIAKPTMGIITIGNKRFNDDGIYIGRRMDKLNLLASPLANPFPLDPNRRREDQVGEILGKYRQWLWQQIKTRNNVYREICRIRNMVLKEQDVALLCWCAPLACHGDVVEVAVEWMVKGRKLV